MVSSILLALLALVAGVTIDARRAPARQISTVLALDAVHVYQHFVSPRLPAAGIRCRFTPTCSRYAEGALQRYGILRGSWLALRRIARCGPWTPAGTVDRIE